MFSTAHITPALVGRYRASGLTKYDYAAIMAGIAAYAEAEAAFEAACLAAYAHTDGWHGFTRAQLGGHGWLCPHTPRPAATGRVSQ